MEWPRRLPKIPAIAAAAVAVGLLPMPSEYYTLLRVFLCGVAFYYLGHPQAISDREKWALVGLAVLHNPLVPIELGDRRLWAIVNVGTVVYLWVLGRRGARTSRWS